MSEIKKKFNKKEYDREYNKLYYKKYKSSYFKKYYELNRKEILERCKLYAQNNKEKIKLLKKQRKLNI